MCLIVRRGDDLTAATRDIPVYKIYIRRDDGMHYSPYAEKCAGCLNPGDVLSDELLPMRRVRGIDDKDFIYEGVFHAFTSLNDEFFATYDELCREYMRDAVKVYSMAVPKGAKHILSHDGKQIGARELYVVGEVDWWWLAMGRIRRFLVWLFFRV